jgi:hypothetical protein
MGDTEVLPTKFANKLCHPPPPFVLLDNGVKKMGSGNMSATDQELARVK